MASQNPNDNQMISSSPTAAFHGDSIFANVVQAPEDPILGTDWLRAKARVGDPGDHRGIVCDPHVFRLLKHWLKAGEPDPFYDPLNDYVILPTAFDIETHRDRGLTVNALIEDWEIISGDTDKQGKVAAEQTALVGSVSVAHVKKDQPYAETHATIVVHPRSEGKQHVELRAVSVTTSG